MRFQWLIVTVLLSACAGSPMDPGPSTVTLSGTLTATNGGQPLAGVTVDVAGQQATTNSAGQFTLTTPPGRHRLMLSGAGILPRVQSVNAGPVTLDAITQSNGFDLAFYRQMVRNGYEAPTGLEPLRRWTSAPSFDVHTVDDAGGAVDPALRAAVTAAIAETVPLLTGGRFTASFGSGVPVRFVTQLGTACGRAPVGPIGASIDLKTSCTNLTRTARHETGHVLGFWHTDGATDLMNRSSTGGSTPSARERYHAALAYQRPVGNRDLDED